MTTLSCGRGSRGRRAAACVNQRVSTPPFAPEPPLPAGPDIILTLKILVTAVTVLLLASLAALARGNPRLHGRLNTVFFVLTMGTVVGFEGLLQFVDVKSAFDPPTREALRV